jgi:hypothetical protein
MGEILLQHGSLEHSELLAIVPYPHGHRKPTAQNPIGGLNVPPESSIIDVWG